VLKVSNSLHVSKALKEVILSILSDKNASDIVAIDLAGKSDLADFMIIASGNNARHVGAVADHVVEAIKNTGVTSVASEGQGSGEWAIIDTPLVIVHVFHPDVRPLYNLEKMWEVVIPEAEMVEHVF